MKSKNIKSFIALGIIISGLSVLFGTSCHKTSSDSAATGTFYFHLHTNIDTNEVDDSTALYRDATGRHFGLTVPQFYISGVTLQNAKGTSYTIPNAYILKDLDSEEYIIGTAPVGVYTSVTFNVGLDASANATSPSSYSPGSPLANSSMWYGNTAQGYMFMKLQGFADTTLGQIGTNLVHFSYEIGGSSHLKSITMPTRGTGAYASYLPYTLVAGGTQYIHIICDYGALLFPIDFKTQDSTDSHSLRPGIADTIANNMQQLFHYEE